MAIIFIIKYIVMDWLICIGCVTLTIVAIVSVIKFLEGYVHDIKDKENR